MVYGNSNRTHKEAEKTGKLDAWLRFSLSGKIISDNGKQFKDNPFKYWCEKLCICQCFASVKHPQANGLVERANRRLGKGIKARLDERSKNSLEKISHVLWAHRTMIKSSNGETPFSLMYGAEAVIPVEIGMPTLRIAEVDMIKNDEALGVNLDLLEEKIEQATIQEARSKAKMDKYYNARVRNTSFCSEDFVNQNNEASHAKDKGKIEPKWEGQYEVTEALRKGAYLETTTEIPFHEHGTSTTLKKFIRMKCKHLSHTRQSSEKGTAQIFFIVISLSFNE
uniref:Reverse transcriptase domain-containing protein n=1 Tax=Tanacetum cinerariifolium TaxID=118510 RepID=A0A699HMI5_TANCI|nr:reverse transcriptase domain-containing protein [Tanacetum cinerariifolium]